MSKNCLGRVSMVPKGAYNAATVYERLDVVTHDGASYIVLRKVQGVTPVDGEDYMLLVQDGDTPDLSVGTVTTLAAGSKATASIGGTPDKPELNLGIPKGDTGATPELSIGKVTTLEPGSEAKAEFSGTADKPVLNLELPRGASGGVDVANAEVGQTIIVKAVDASGKPTAWEAADMASGETPDEYVVLLNKTFETAVLNTDEWGGESHQYNGRHFWTTDEDGNDVDADGIYIRIHLPSQTGVTSGEIKIGVGQGKPGEWLDWSGNNQPQPYVGRAGFVGENNEKWAMWEYDLREQTLKTAYVGKQTWKGNFQESELQYVTSFPQAVANNNWTSWSGAELLLISGSLPAGTQLLVYARKRNPAKFKNIPNWGISA